MMEAVPVAVVDEAIVLLSAARGDANTRAPAGAATGSSTGTIPGTAQQEPRGAEAAAAAAPSPFSLRRDPSKQGEEAGESLQQAVRTAVSPAGGQQPLPKIDRQVGGEEGREGWYWREGWYC